MKTSKIKTVVSIKPHQTEKYGTTFYHNLEMENGDKINIGKKKEQKVGWELTYEITEQGQHEYNKARAVAPDSFNQSSPKQDVNVNNSIARAVAFKGAVEFDNQCTPEVVLKNAKYFYDNWLCDNYDVQKKVDKVAKAFNDKFADESDDLPF